MSLLKLCNDDSRQFSPEFKELLHAIQPEMGLYETFKQGAQHARMHVIGMCAEFAEKHPQRSNERRALVKAMEEEGWNQDVRSKNKLAFQEFQHLQGTNDALWSEFSQKASVDLLHECGKVRSRQGDGESLLADASLLHWQNTGKMPTRKQYRGLLGGYLDNRFQPLGYGGGSKPKASSQPQLSSEPTSTTRTTSVEEAFGSEQVVAPIESVMTVDVESAAVEMETVDVEEERIDTIVEALSDLNLDAVYTRDDLRDKLEAVAHRIEQLLELTKRQSRWRR